jgi:cytochrome c-type biogenesis protein CcmH/NrfG
MCKPMLVTLPFVLLLLDYWPLRRIRDQGSDVGRQLLRLLTEKIPLIALSAVSSIITFLAQRGALGWAEQIAMLARVKNALVSYVVYVWQMFWPANLAVFYPHPENRLLPWEIILALTVLVGITVAATILRKNAPYFITGWLWYVGMLVPVIGLVQVGWQSHADRYTYLPQIGLYIAGTWGVADLTASWRRQHILLGTAALLVIGALSWRAWIQTSYWRNSETLFTHAVAVTGNNDVAQNNLGTVCLQKGQLDEAIAHYKKAVAIKPESAEMQYNLGNALARKGDWADAIDCYQAALRRLPDSAKVHNNLGAALVRLGKSDDALEQFSEALQINRNYPEAHCNLGRMLARLGRRDEAVAHLREALRLKPGYEEARKQLRELGVTVVQ